MSHSVVSNAKPQRAGKCRYLITMRQGFLEGFGTHVNINDMWNIYFSIESSQTYLSQKFIIYHLLSFYITWGGWGGVINPWQGMCVIEYIVIISIYDLCTNWKRHNMDKLWLILLNARKLTCMHFTSKVNIFVQYGLIKVTIYAFVKEFIVKGVFGNSGCNFASFSHLCQR